jgi:mono/diheme cytochrome c family protein
MIRTVITLILATTSYAFSQSIENGKTIYDESCALCHSIGKGRMVGPDLAGVAETRDKEWLFRFINNSQEMVASGDETAKALYAEYNNLPMPSHDFSENELEDLLAFIKEASADVAIAAAEVPVVENIDQKALEGTIEYPVWFLITASFIGLIIIVLLIVIFKLYKLARQMSTSPIK